MSERLFLLEIFVENLHIDNCQNLGVQFKQACVKFKFLNYPFLELLEDVQCREVAPDDQCDVQFASGKSCLFAFRSCGSEPVPNLDLDLSTFVLTDKEESKLVGSASVSLAGSFTNLMDLTQNNEVYTTPLTKTFKNKLKLKNGQREAGSVTVLVRLSCFGRIIVTQFQMSGQENKSFLFKAVSDVQCKMFAAGDITSDSPKDKQCQKVQDDPSKAQKMIGEQSPEDNIPGMYPGGMYPGGMWPQPGGYWPPQTTPMGMSSGAGMPPFMPSAGAAPPQAKESMDYRVIHVDVNGHQMQVKVLRNQRKTGELPGPRCNLRAAESTYSTCSSGSK